MDGYAVRAGDTIGASESMPGYLRVVGTVKMGEDASRRSPLQEGECAAISTGGMLHPGADSVVMVEYTADAGDGKIEVMQAAAVGQHIQLAGEDVRAGMRLLEPGVRLGAPEIAVLATFGVLPTPVFKRPRVAIVSTGDEIVPADSYPRPGQVRDSNSYSMASQILAAGGEPILCGRVEDEAESLATAIRKTLDDGADVVMVSGGSSVGARDVTAEVLDSLGPPGILLHGINVKPGKPTIVAAVGETPLLGMPGYPVSSMIIFHRFIRPLIWRLSGLSPLPDPFPVVATARLGRSLHSRGGREEYVRVSLADADDGGSPIATPLLGGSASFTSLLGADGLVRVDSNVEGMDQGASVKVLAL
jgi:molybdopterin molybdotransferase